MTVVLNFIQSIINLGAAAFLPIVICIVGVIFRLDFWKALKGGLLVGIGFTGLNAVVSILINAIAPVTEFYAAEGAGFTIVDAGWPTLAGAAWATPFAVLIIPICLIVNIVLLRSRLTKTLNVDIWDYWHFMFTGAMAYYLLIGKGVNTGIAYAVGLIIAIVLSIVALFLADKMQPSWSEFFGLEGTSVPHQAALTTWLFCSFFNKIIAKIPGLNKIDFNLDTFSKKIGGIGETTILGFIMGAVLALFTRQGITGALSCGVGIAASVVLMPRMVSLLLEGITPIGKAATAYMKKKVGSEQEIYMGMDVALCLGDPTTITSGIIMIPIMVALALIIPGNSYFPLSTLPALVYTTCMASLAARGNLFRTILLSTLYLAFQIVVLNFLAIPATMIVEASGTFDVGGVQIVGSALDAFPNLIVGIIGKLAHLF